MDNKTDIFISYVDADEAWHQKLDKHLQPLIRKKKVSVWSHKDLIPGDHRQDKIKEARDSASIAILLVSPSFLASTFAEEELEAIVKAEEEKRLTIFWVYLSTCLYDEMIPKKYDPANKKPLALLSDAEQDAELARIIKDLAGKIKSNESKPPYCFIRRRFMYPILALILAMLLFCPIRQALDIYYKAREIKLLRNSISLCYLDGAVPDNPLQKFSDICEKKKFSNLLYELAEKFCKDTLETNKYIDPIYDKDVLIIKFHFPADDIKKGYGAKLTIGKEYREKYLNGFSPRRQIINGCWHYSKRPPENGKEYIPEFVCQTIESGTNELKIEKHD